MRANVLATLALALGLLTGCGQQPGTSAPAATGGSSGWTRLPDGPLTGRTGAVVAAVGGLGYVVGGWEFLCPPAAECVPMEEPLLRDGASVDPGTGEWRPIAPAPYGLRHAATAVIGDDLFLLSGCRAGPDCDGALGLLRYDTAADTWSELASLPGEVRYADLVAAAGRLVALATSDEHGERPDHVYDTADDRWVELPDDPLPAVYDRQAVADGDRLLVLGSPMDPDPAAEAQPKVGAALDLATRAWTRLPDAPGAGYQVWRAGGTAWLNPHFGTEGGGVLDLTTDAWQPFPARPEGGGWTGDLAGLVGPDGAVYEYDAGWVRDARSDEWLRIPERPGDADEESLTAVGHALLVFGGQSWDGQDSPTSGGTLVAEAWAWWPPA